MLDVVDVTGRHSLVTLPSLLGLPPKADLEGQDVTDAADMLDRLVEEFPDTDLSKIEITRFNEEEIRTKLEEVNLFESKWAADGNVSQLCWTRSKDGSACLLLPKKEALVIWKWDGPEGNYILKGSIKGEQIRSFHEDEESAVICAEMSLSLHGKEYTDALMRKPKGGRGAARV
ncbi:MAG: hypothetical protein AB7O65_06425 [Candidatus Korobacteraceae bacterium]